MADARTAMRQAFIAFFNQRHANVEWDWDKSTGLLGQFDPDNPRVLVDAVFDLNELIERLATAAEKAKDTET